MTNVPSLSLVVIGASFQLVGLVTAAVGVTRTRQQYAPDRAGVLDKLLGWFKSIPLALQRRWRWIQKNVLRTRTSVTKTHKTSWSNLTVDTTITGAVQVTHAALTVDLPVEERLRILDERSRTLREDFNELERRMAASLKSLESAHSSIAQARLELTSLTKDEVKTLAVGGLGLQSWGLLATAAGTAIGLFGTLIA